MAENYEYPLVNYHFQVDWGSTKMAFTEVTGLIVESEVIEYRTGDSPEFHKRKMPGPQKIGNITLKRGVMAKDNDMFNWWNTVKLNKIERRTVTISLLNEEHEPVVTWRAIKAWPVKLQASDLKADGKDVLIETMELAHEGLTIINE